MAQQPFAQPDPIPNSLPPVWDLVIQDMIARNEFGTKKYGTPLRPYDGRDTLWDSYCEILDLAVYIRKAIYERDIKNGDTTKT